MLNGKFRRFFVKKSEEEKLGFKWSLKGKSDFQKTRTSWRYLADELKRLHDELDDRCTSEKIYLPSWMHSFMIKEGFFTADQLENIYDFHKVEEVDEFV